MAREGSAVKFAVEGGGIDGIVGWMKEFVQATAGEHES